MPCEHLYCWRSSESQGHAKPFLWQQGGTEPRSWAHSSSCARARLDLCELCNFCATSASGDSPITDRAIGHRSTTRPTSRPALSSPVQLGHGRSAQLHQHTPALTGWTLRFCVEGHAPARAAHEFKKRTLQSHGRTSGRATVTCAIGWRCVGSEHRVPGFGRAGVHAKLNVLSRSQDNYSRN